MTGGRRRAIPLLAAVAGLAITLHAPILSGLAQMHADPGDARHLNYVLEHAWLWATGDANHADLWSPPVFFPAKETGPYSEMLLGVAPFYAPFRAAGLSPEISLQLWTFLVLLLDFGASYLLLRRGFVFGIEGATAGAYLFSFASLRARRLGHQHLLPHFFTALALLGLVEALRPPRDGEVDRRSRGILLFAAALVAQLYAGFYLLWFLALGLAIALAFALANREHRTLLAANLARFRFLWLGSIGVAAVLSWPLARAHLAAARAVGYRTFDDVRPFLPPVKAWLDPGPWSWAYGAWMGRWETFRGQPLEWEKPLFLGFVTTVLVLWGLQLTWRRAAVRAVVLPGIVLAVLATSWPFLPFSPWQLVYDFVPGAKAIRAVPRFALLLLVPAALGLAAVADELVRRRRGLFLCSVFLVILEQGQTLKSFDYRPVRARVDALARSVPAGCRTFFYVAGKNAPPFWQMQVDAMWAGTLRGIPTLNGYSSNFPPGWMPLLENVVRDPADVPRLQSALESWARESRLDLAGVCRVGLPAAPPPALSGSSR
jgi:hypothetical protein